MNFAIAVTQTTSSWKFEDFYEDALKFNEMSTGLTEFPITMNVKRDPWSTLIFWELRGLSKIPSPFPEKEKLQALIREYAPDVLIRTAYAWRRCMHEEGRNELQGLSRAHLSEECMVKYNMGPDSAGDDLTSAYASFLDTGDDMLDGFGPDEFSGGPQGGSGGGCGGEEDKM